MDKRPVLFQDLNKVDAILMVVTLIVTIIALTMCSCSSEKYLCWEEYVTTRPDPCTACTEAKTKCKTVAPYGWLDWDTKETCVRYEINVPNAIWSVVLVETIIAPLFITGYDIMEPIEVKRECRSGGT